MMPRPSMPADLIAIDLLLQRWSKYGILAGVGQPLCTLARLIAEAAGAALPGGDDRMPDEILELDQVISHSHPRTRRFIAVWYSSNDPVVVKAKRMGMSRQAVYTHWHAHLRYIQGAWCERVAAIETLKRARIKRLTPAMSLHQLQA